MVFYRCNISAIAEERVKKYEKEQENQNQHQNNRYASSQGIQTPLSLELLLAQCSVFHSRNRLDLPFGTRHCRQEPSRSQLRAFLFLRSAHRCNCRCHWCCCSIFVGRNLILSHTQRTFHQFEKAYFLRVFLVKKEPRKRKGKRLSACFFCHLLAFFVAC